MSELVNELEHLGYVTRVPDPTDSRARLVVPAQRAVEADRVLEAYWRQLESKLADQYGPRQVNEVIELLSALRKALK